MVEIQYDNTYVLIDAIKIISLRITKNVSERDVNGLSVDWVSKHVYWTDQDRRTVEISDYNGRNRRILISSGLRRPRGVLVDPING